MKASFISKLGFKVRLESMVKKNKTDLKIIVQTLQMDYFLRFNNQIGK